MATFVILCVNRIQVKYPQNTRKAVCKLLRWSLHKRQPKLLSLNFVQKSIVDKDEISITVLFRTRD